MLRLVTKGIHTQQATCTASQNGCQKQRCLRDTPQVFFCFDFIGQHKDESCGIDYKKIDQHIKNLSGGK